jgi:hypothetical protein
MPSTWTIRGAVAGDAVAIETALVAVPEFAGMLLPLELREVWLWLYARYGEELQNVLLAEDAQGTVVAHYGLSRLPYVLDGERVDAGVAALLGVDPAYRKTAIVLDITTRLLRLFRASGWRFVTGLANRAGLLEFHKAFGFKDIGEVPIFAKPLRLRSIARAVLPPAAFVPLSPLLAVAEWLWHALLGWLAGARGAVQLEPIAQFDAAVAATSAELAKAHRYFAGRDDPAVLNARFFGLASREYHVFRIVRGRATLGYVALRIMDMRGFLAVGIVDLCFDFAERDTARAVFRALDRFAIAHRADLIAMLTNSVPLIAQLRRQFYFKTPEAFRLVIFEPAKTFGLGASKIADWFITWFEHDYV